MSTRRTELSAFKVGRPESVPVIVRTEQGVSELETCKFAGIKDAPMIHLIKGVRKMMPGLEAHEALYLLVETKKGPVMVTGSTTFGQAWAAYGEEAEDGFLHAVACKENVFGALY
jgi:hypothetical protein